jgi:hypothetical protein
MPDPRDDLEPDRPDAPTGLFLSRRGNWFHDGQRVSHRRLAGLLSRSVARSADGALVVTTGRDILPFVAEDAPLMVREVRAGVAALELVLSDETTAALEGPIVVGVDGRLRTALPGRRLWAVFGRSAQQALEPWFTSEDRVVVGARSWTVVPAMAGTRWDADPAVSDVGQPVNPDGGGNTHRKRVQEQGS